MAACQIHRGTNKPIIQDLCVHNLLGAHLDDAEATVVYTYQTIKKRSRCLFDCRLFTADISALAVQMLATNTSSSQLQGRAGPVQREPLLCDQLPRQQQPVCESSLGQQCFPLFRAQPRVLCLVNRSLKLVQGTALDCPHQVLGRLRPTSGGEATVGQTRFVELLDEFHRLAHLARVERGLVRKPQRQAQGGLLPTMHGFSQGPSSMFPSLRLSCCLVGLRQLVCQRLGRAVCLAVGIGKGRLLVAFRCQRRLVPWCRPRREVVARVCRPHEAWLRVGRPHEAWLAQGQCLVALAMLVHGFAHRRQQSICIFAARPALVNAARHRVAHGLARSQRGGGVGCGLMA
mmetsp:Transcript_140158/g.447264  ORF Transcript_140158/g.447264 Transcript_140158/m.447264 type:complete len:345 (+) Transcript_140158:201-1235(+)